RPERIARQAEAAQRFAFQLGHDFSVMETFFRNPHYQIFVPFQLGHDFSVMETAALFRPLLISKKVLFSRATSTSTKNLRK
ncbi:MAG: hypothetical protein QG575_1585, partial [Euryarchaeota archaeon]|nr:hypothetical protein [Euryarchaeota archaeon]